MLCDLAISNTFQGGGGGGDGGKEEEEAYQRGAFLQLGLYWLKTELIRFIKTIYREKIKLQID